MTKRSREGRRKKKHVSKMRKRGTHITRKGSVLTLRREKEKIK